MTATHDHDSTTTAAPKLYLSLPRVTFSVSRMMLAVAAVAILLTVCRLAIYRVSQEEVICVATDALQRSDESFRPDGSWRGCTELAAMPPWTVDVFPAGSRYLVRIVMVSETGHVRQVMAFKESDRVVSNERFQHIEAVPLRGTLET
jgi:hypothetical protein